MAIRRRYLTPDEHFRYLSYIVQSLNDIRRTLYALVAKDEVRIEAMLKKLKKANDQLEAAEHAALKGK